MKLISKVRDIFYVYRHELLNSHLKKIIFSIFFPGKVRIPSLDSKQNLIEEEVIFNFVKIDSERFNDGIATVLSNEFNYVDLPSFNSTYSEVFEKEIYKFRTKNEQPYIIDCGSNIGLSILYFKKLYPNSELIGFEPDPKIFNVLSRNIKQYNLSNVSIFQKALWKEKTSLNFFTEGADGGRLSVGTIDEIENIQVETILLSEFINKEVDFLKIDIEGAELDVLEEIQNKLHFVKKIFIEYHSFINKKQVLDKILNILDKNGFNYYLSSIGTSSDSPFYVKNISLGMDNQLNIFAVNKSENIN